MSPHAEINKFPKDSIGLQGRRTAELAQEAVDARWTINSQADGIRHMKHHIDFQVELYYKYIIEYFYINRTQKLY